MSELASREEWMRRTGPLYPGLVALRRMSSLPVLTSADPAEDDLSRAAAWSTLVAALIGGVLAGVAAVLLAVGAHPAVALALFVTCTMVATGARGERGAATMVERLSGGVSFGRDSVGVAGVLALLAVVGIRAACLGGTETDSWIGAIVVSQTVAPAVALLLLRIGDRAEAPVAHERGLMFGAVSWLGFGVASAVAVVVTLVFGGFVGLLCLAVAALVGFALGLVVQRRDGGMGRQSLAAVAVACELVVLIGFALANPS